MLDSDLAELYGVETKRLNEQVRRNATRFPEEFILNSLLLKEKWIPTEFMFTLNKDEVEILRIFSKIRQFITENTEIRLEIAEIKYTVEQISKKQRGHGQNIELLFEYIDRLQEKEERTVTKPSSKGEIGFKVGGK